MKEGKLADPEEFRAVDLIILVGKNGRNAQSE
jgi:hypothetical protein